MTQTNLIFESPNYLNNLTAKVEVNPKQWKTPDGEFLEINTNNWTISSNSQSASITKWFVDESKHQMTLENDQEGFVPLSQIFAISMVGQLFPKDLTKYLSSIDEIYTHQMKELNKDTPPNQDSSITQDDKQDSSSPNGNKPNDDENLW